MKVAATPRLGIVLTILAVWVGSPVAWAAGRAGPVPRADPAAGDGGVSAFYSWGLPAPAAAGRLLRKAPLPERLMPEAASAGDRILYSSIQGVDGVTPIVTSGAVYLPKGQPPAGGWPLVAWAHGTTGLADVCAPSWQGQSHDDALYVNDWLAHGYAVAATDYEGLGTPGPLPYLIARSAAYSVLDAARAAEAAYPTLSRRIVVVGQSQGAHAAISAGLFAPLYAPDLDIKGVIVTGIPGQGGFAPRADPDHFDTGAAHAGDPVQPAATRRGDVADQTGFSMLLYLYFFLDYSQSDPGFRRQDRLTPLGAKAYGELTKHCNSVSLAAAMKAGATFKDVFTQDPAPHETAIGWRRRYPDLTFKTPVFMGIGLADINTKPEPAFTVARAACARASNVTVRFYPGFDHGGTPIAAEADSIPFAAQVLAGQTPTGDCATLRWPAPSP